MPRAESALAGFADLELEKNRVSRPEGTFRCGRNISDVVLMANTISPRSSSANRHDFSPLLRSAWASTFPAFWAEYWPIDIFG
jgi:hypothetical protein